MRYSNRELKMLRFVAAFVPMLMLLGCATVETWGELARAKIVVKDVVVCCSNDVAYAVNIVGEKYVSVIPSVMTRWDDAYVERFDFCNPNGFRVFTNECSLVESGSYSSESHLVAMSGSQWMDEEYLSKKVLVGRDECNFGIMVADLNDWRRYLVVPCRKCDLPSGREEWSFVVLYDPVIEFQGGFYTKNETNFRVVLCRCVYTPFTFAIDIVTLPFQVCLGLFTNCRAI